MRSARNYAKHTKIKAARRRYNIKETLTKQGITDPDKVRVHEDFLMKTMRVNPDFLLSSYRISQSQQIRMD